ncbi:Transcriptional regulator [Coniosporium tulheliwenetii]|uniref:Transcriptional regulator n=1 Tax=Coniosporium tulheliwenetii TaxID=3383036 RepID=A0ACC2ZEQ6_9PEZI|nr:Transcriptional regulator [Cladosporium sp. JES 115]
MPPVSSKSKGSKAQPRDNRRSRSRNTTPISTGPSIVIKSEPSTSTYIQTPFTHFSIPLDSTVEAIFERSGNSKDIPGAASLQAAHEAVKTQLLAHVKERGELCHRVMRELSKKRKERIEQEREKERTDREAEEGRVKLKKEKRKRETQEERPPAVGAHGLARQDGVDVHKGTPRCPVNQGPSDMNRYSIRELLVKQPAKRVAAPDPRHLCAIRFLYHVFSHISATSSAGTAPNAEAGPSRSASEADRQPPPADPVTHYETFGSDPTTFPDPTIYHIREVTPGMTEEEKKEIYCVAEYPHDDLHDLTPGTPPDRDFSNAKPANQVNATVFANYVEPYIRPLTEEDIAFLKERGDRVTPFIMPRRGPRHYKEIWAEEDSGMAVDGVKKEMADPNEVRGSIEDINDEVAETDAVSTGPVLARLISTLRPEARPTTAATTNGEVNGTTNHDPDRMDVDGEPTNHVNDLNLPGQLVHAGFIPPSTNPDYTAHYDDAVAGRLRYLQSELRRQSIINGARKARLLELAEVRMAQQEYSTIADDLDNQLNAAYLKRNRSLSKTVKKKPGVPKAGQGVAVVKGEGRGVGEGIRDLMGRKKEWNSLIGPETVFPEDIMKAYEEKEAEGWDNVEE